MSERTRLPVDAVAVQTVIPKILWLRWLLCLALTPTLSGRDLDPAIRERLRIAAAASANPRLRVALDRALDGELDDEDLVGLEAGAVAAPSRQ